MTYINSKMRQNCNPYTSKALHWCAYLCDSWVSCKYISCNCNSWLKIVCFSACSSELLKLCFVMPYIYDVSCVSDGKKYRLLHGEKTTCSALCFCLNRWCWSQLSCCEGISVHNGNQCSGIADFCLYFGRPYDAC